MMVSRYLLPIFITLLVGVLIFKGLRAGKRPAQVEGDTGPPPEAFSQPEVAISQVEPVRLLKYIQKDRVLQEEAEKCLDDAAALFKERDFAASLAELDRANAICHPSARVLNLRGSCHAELGDFKKALPDFEKAADLTKGNSSVRFNIGEVHFVTRQWRQALDAFEKLNEELPPENIKLSRLVEFKILLCKNRLGMTTEVKELATKYDDQDSSPFYWYASAMIEFQTGDRNEALKLLNQASLRFPNPADLAPWKDTMTEYRG